MVTDSTSSFALYRPLLGLSLTHLISLVTSLPHSPLISLGHVGTVLRSTHDTILSAQSADQGSTSLLREIVEGGHLVGVGKRDVLGVEPGRDLWRRVVG